LRGKEVLAQEDVLIAVPVDISDADGKRRRELSSDGNGTASNNPGG